jgi:hypothetical protein
LKKLKPPTVSIKDPVIGSPNTPKKSKFTPEQIKFLENNVSGKHFAELATLFNKQFKTDFTNVQIKNICMYKGIKNNRIKGGHSWTKEELSFLEKHGGEKTRRELTALINSDLNLSLSYKEVNYACIHHKIKTAKVPAKCTQEILAFIRQNSTETFSSLTRMINDTFGTMFSKKQVYNFIKYYKYKTVYKRNLHELPVNTERIKRSHIFIKVSMTGPKEMRWQLKHRWLWEQANGKIPQGMNIIFLDNNPLNCTLENLFMISHDENTIMSKNYLHTENPESTLAGIVVAKHFLAIHSKLNKTLGPEEHRRFITRESAKRINKRKKESQKQANNIPKETIYDTRD